jgi:hypothetical protein
MLSFDGWDASCMISTYDGFIWTRDKFILDKRPIPIVRQMLPLAGII